MARVDLTVMGAGIFGLSIAWEAARRGARVRLIEPVAIGAGASGGLVGALAPHVPEQWNAKKAFQLESLLMAGGWWAAAEATSGLASGYGRTGRLQGLADTQAVDLARARAGSAAALWGDAARWQVRPARGLPWEPTSASGWLVEDDLSARIQPKAALAVLVAAIRAQKGEVLVGDAAGMGPVDKGPVDTGPVIWATGVAGLQAMAAGGGVKGQAIAVKCATPNFTTPNFTTTSAAQLFVAGLHIVPHADGTVAIGSTSENQWDDPQQVDALGEALLARAVAALPVLEGAGVVARWAGLRPRAASRAPLLGGWPGRAGHFVANGGFKIGFGMAPKVAQVMVDLVLEGRDAIPEGFRA